MVFLKKISLLGIFFLSSLFISAQNQLPKIIKAQQINPTTIELKLDTHRHIFIDFYSGHIFRMVVDSMQNSMHAPQAKPEAQILVSNPRKALKLLQLHTTADSVFISTAQITIAFSKQNTLFTVKNKHSHQTIIRETAPLKLNQQQILMQLHAQPNEYFYGGGVQNGRFSHRGKIIAIKNENQWTDGGVASPTPFYWSTAGYGMMQYTFKPGHYDFDATDKNTVAIQYKTTYFDAFFMISATPKALLNDYYQLTGHPVLLPKFAFYEGHLNAYNRDYWKQDSTGILFEDGKRYVESQKNNGGIKESLNGEKNNYQFSARAVIDRYAAHNMPLGWILPNDGYGAGYGQDSTLEGNILNLKRFGDYARKHGVQVGLWTQSDLHPKPGVPALLQRDIVREIGQAGVRVLKTDVAWVGAGYSFGLNGIAEVANDMVNYGNQARPFIITLDGWAGTQRYAAVWSGDQTGGYWEYIRFHIPTYIGAGLSGEPNITSDMDGIFGGGNIPINVRDYQWRTFTPMQLNMDGWGTNPKYPQALGEPATSINRDYLKLKSELLPYTYSIAHQAVNGLPMVRAMFLAYPNAYTYETATKYQFMYGPYFLIAPIYKNTQADEKGNDIRHNIYLPKGTWIDYFTGVKYTGNCVWNSFDAPLWKLPIFVKSGAIIPLTNANNNPSQINKKQRVFAFYPDGSSSFTLYNDDGKTIAYKNGKSVQTRITSQTNSDGKATLTIYPTQGNFKGFVKEKSTVLKVNVSEQPKKIIARINKKKVKLKKVASLQAFQKQTNVYYYNPNPEFNRFATPGSSFAQVSIKRNPQVLIKLAPVNVTQTHIDVIIKGYAFTVPNHFTQKKGTLSTPQGAGVTQENTHPFSIRPSWLPLPNADYYEIIFNHMRYTHIKDTAFLFSNLQPKTRYTFKLRAVNASGNSPWVTFSAQTAINPLQYAIKGVSAYATAPTQPGFSLQHLVDNDPRTLWHSRYHKDAIPFVLTVDLHSTNTLEKMQYLPRKNGLNGVLTKGEIYTSLNQKEWKKAGSFTWKANNTTKEFIFKQPVKARYVKLKITAGVGNYGSGRELYVFKVPGTKSILAGDINSDGKIDINDLTSYTNYVGLQKGDADFEGYISRGDVNQNNRIDAYDISTVATQLSGGVHLNQPKKPSGKLTLSVNKKSFSKGDTLRVTVTGNVLKNVNALGFALPYNPDEYSYLGIKILHTKSMKNLTKSRLHTNGKTVLYPTFVNVGNQQTLSGTHKLFIIKMVAKKSGKFNLQIQNSMLVSKSLDTVKK